MSISGIERLEEMGASARKASRALAKVSGHARDRALAGIADALLSREEEILAANAQDHQAALRHGLGDAVLGRLVLDPQRLRRVADAVRSVASLPDPVSETFDMRDLPNGLRAGKRRVPLGVIGAIYESRPNITVDISVLCLKSANAVILRGGREAIRSNTALAKLVRDCVAEAGLPPDSVQFVESTDRALVGHMLTMSQYIDLVVPRGGADLVRRVAAEATMPAVTGGVGVCHIYVDRSANIEMAVSIANDAKVSHPYVCNAVDTILVHSAIAPAYLPALAAKLGETPVEMRCDRRALSIVGHDNGLNTVPVTDKDWGTEFLSLTAAVKVVDSLEEAVEHIDTYGSGHTEAIVTEDYTSAMSFLNEVDSSVVAVNASTRFNDGGELGLGAEVAISTNKLHARGPMGLKELTSYKWIVMGMGQVRG